MSMKTNAVDLVREVTRLAELDQDAVRRVGEHLHMALQLALDRQSLLGRKKTQTRTRTTITPAPIPAAVPELATGSTSPIAADAETETAERILSPAAASVVKDVWSRLLMMYHGTHSPDFEGSDCDAYRGAVDVSLCAAVLALEDLLRDAGELS